MKEIIILTILIFSFVDSNASAKSNNQRNQNETSDELYKLFDSEIFSLSKKNEDAFDAASSIYVLSSEDIRRSGATNIPEALRLVPGLQVARIDGHKWAISARGFNAQFSNKMLVMIDGRTVYTPVFSGAVWDMQDYLLEDIEKIEVIRGSGGAIWGANAVNGIINIITKNAVDSQGVYASSTVGNQDRFIGEVRYGGVTKDLNHYRVYAKQVNRDEMKRLNSNQDNDDGYRQSQAGFRYDIRSIKDNTVSIHGDIRDGKANNYFDFSSITGLSSRQPTNKDSRGANITVNWERDISKKSSFVLQSYFDYDKVDIDVLRVSDKTADIDFQYFYDFNRQHQMAFGAGYRLINDDIDEKTLLSPSIIPLDYTPNKRSNQIFSAFLQDKIGLIADVLYLTIGSKFEHNDYTGFEIQPSAKLTFFPSRTQTAWTSISRAVRTPTRAEDGLNLLNGSSQQGSTEYESENVIAYELGYRVKPTRTSLIDVALFYNDYSDLRTFNAKNGFSSVATNFGEGESYGVEITAKWQANKNWRLEAGYDFLKLDVRNNQIAGESTSFPIVSVEEQSPKNQFRLRSNYNITSKIEFDNIYYYVDSLPKAGTNVPSYSRFDTRVGYLFSPNIEFSVGAQNLTDRRHQEFDKALFGNPTEVGRTVYFKTVVRFW